MKKVTLLVVIMMFFITGIVYSDVAVSDIDVSIEKGEVLSIEEVESDLSFINKIQYVTIEILSGEFKGEVVTEVENVLSDSYVMDIDVEVGQKILLSIETYPNGERDIYITSEVRDSYIMWLVIIFMIVLIYVGKKQGFKTIFTLFITMFFIFMVEIPLLLRGYNAIIVTVVVAIFITVITMSVISGLSKKTLAAIIGTVLGVIIAGGLAIFVSYKVKLTGLSNEEAVMLLNVKDVTFNFRHLLFAGILLGALGAVMDVAMSIASAIDELHNVNSNLSWKRLFDSGMRVGRDIMGTMSNTLILAYTGSMLPLLLLFVSNDDSLLRLINLDLIATEIIRSISGSVGLVLTIPITASIAVILIKDNNYEEHVVAEGHSHHIEHLEDDEETIIED